MPELTELKTWLWVDYDEIGSTNDEALRLSKDLLPNQKIVITAQKQSKGRGRRGRSWISLDGNLFMSMLFSWPLEDCGAITFMVSLALLNTVLKLSPQASVGLKWPNDVLLNNHKLSGILLERGEKNSLVIGIGVNIKNAPSGNNMLYPATSLKAQGVACDRITFLKQYLQEFDNICEKYKQEGLSSIVELWKQKAVGLGQKIIVRTPKMEEKGIFANINHDGMLQLKMNDGTIKTISAGDVFFDDNGDNN